MNKRKLENHLPDDKQIEENDSVSNLQSYINSEKFMIDFDYNSQEKFQKCLWDLLKNIDSQICIQSEDIPSLISLVMDNCPVKQLVGLSLIKKYSTKGDDWASELINAGVIQILIPILDKKEPQQYTREALIIFINLSSYNDDIVQEMISEDIHLKMCEILKWDQYSAFNRVYSLWCLSNLILSNEITLIEFQNKECCKVLMNLYNQIKKFPKKVIEIVHFIINFITVAPDNNHEYETLIMFPILLNILEEFHTVSENEEIIIETLYALSKFSDWVIFGWAALELSDKLEKLLINLISSSNPNVILNVLKIISNHLYWDKEIQIKYVEDKLCNHLMALARLENDEIIQQILSIIYTIFESEDEFVLEYFEQAGLTNLPLEFINSNNKDTLQECIWWIWRTFDELDINEELIDSLISAIPKVDDFTQLKILNIFEKTMAKGNWYFTNPFLKYLEKDKLLDQLEKMQYSVNQEVYESASNLLEEISGDETLEIKTLVENYWNEDFNNISF